MTKHKEDLQIGQKRDRQAAFLKHYKELGVIRHACEAIGIHRCTYHKWLREDSDFVTDFEAAKEDSNDTLLKEARRRAMTGVEENIYYKGKPVGRKVWHSDTLLMFLMKANDPGTFRENNAGGPSGMPLPGGDRMKIHLRQEVVMDENINRILCDLEEALVDAGIGAGAEESAV